MMSSKVPNLRFDEFSGEWEKKQISKILTIGSGRNYKHLSDGEIPVYGTGGYMLSVNDYLYDGESVGIGRKGTIDKPVFLTGKFWTVDTLFYTHSFKDNIPKFIYFLFQKINWYNYNEAGGVPSLSKVTIGKINNFIPKPKEQQKIANCLSSLDNLIESQNKKVEVLKKHKKGLMQQLFPKGSEENPKVRFKDFYGKWKSYNIEDLAKVITGNKDTQNKVDNATYPFFVRSQTIERINSFSYDGEAILTSGDGVGVGKNFHYIVGKFDFHQRVYCICDFKECVSGKFIYQYFSEHFYKRVMQLNAKNSVDSIRRAMITEMPISLPTLKEQIKIANCLSSLDNIIEKQNKKIESLEKHKKGLMQQLFVNSEVLDG